MQTHVLLVIVGAGIVGASAAHHLTQLGWRDILVLDKGDLYENDSSTSHAPGGVVALSHSKLMTQMAIYSSDLFSSLKPYRDDRNTCKAVGGLEVPSPPSAGRIWYGCTAKRSLSTPSPICSPPLKPRPKCLLSTWMRLWAASLRPKARSWPVPM